MNSNTINLAVVTGGKTHDVINFQHLFQSFEGVNSYIQHIDDFAAASEATRDSYDVVLFYLMMLEGPTDDGLPGYCGKPKTALARLGQTGQGIVMLHHGLLAYPQWPVWQAMVGMANRELIGYQHDEKLNITVADQTHPITTGLSNWTMVDETYHMANADADNRILLTVHHQNSMETVAWVRQYKASRVFCLQLGHDHQAWEDAAFRTILKRGVVWSSQNS